MTKKTERRKLIDKLDAACRIAVFKRDKGICQWCGKKVSKQNAHTSHVVPKSQGNALRWDMKNLKLLCFNCHIGKWHHRPLEAWEWFSNKFPERTKYLTEHRNDSGKFTVSELKDKLEKLND